MSKTSSNTAGPDCPLTPRSRSSDTPETDDMASMRRTPQEWQAHGEQLERRLNDLYEIILTAIGILDGNEEVIDWRDRDHPELLRKLCEHLEAQCGRFLPENACLSHGEGEKRP